MKKILKELEKQDFIEISNNLDSYISFVDDKKRKDLILKMKKKKKPTEELVSLVDKQIRYFASSDLASACRKAMNKEPHVSSEEMVDDIIKKMKFNINKHLPLEDKLKRLVKEIVRKELVNKKPSELEKMFQKTDIDYTDIAEIIYLIEKDEGDIVETMIENLGQNIATSLIWTIIQRTILVVAGETALRVAAGQFAKRNPALQMLGPIIWGVTGAWLIFDIQGTAYRKTIPACLFIGMRLISKDIEERDRLKRIEDDKYNNINNKETKKIISENNELKKKYRELIAQNEDLEKEAEREIRKSTSKYNIETQKIIKENEELRKRNNDLVVRNSKANKIGIRKQVFKVGQVRGVRDVFSGSIGIEADRLIMQDSYIRGKENELDNLLRQFLNLNIIKSKTRVSFISLIKYGESENVLFKEMNPKLKTICEKHDLIFETLKLRKNNEVHSRFFIFENKEMIIESSPDHSFYNLDRNKFAFRIFEETRFK